MGDSGVIQLKLLERRIRWTAAVAGAACVRIVGIGALLWRKPWSVDELRLRSLAIVDAHGVVRVRVGGQLPDAVIDGRPIPRGDEAAGVLIYDAEGRERGGYATFRRSGTAVLTLDTRTGMVLLLSADSADGAAAKLWGNKFANSIDLRADRTGARITATRDNAIVAQQPAMSESDADDICREINAEAARLPTKPSANEMLQACSRSMPVALCRRCIDRRE